MAVGAQGLRGSGVQLYHLGNLGTTEAQDVYECDGTIRTYQAVCSGKKGVGLRGAPNGILYQRSYCPLIIT